MTSPRSRIQIHQPSYATCASFGRLGLQASFNEHARREYRASAEPRSVVATCWPYARRLIPAPPGLEWLHDERELVDLFLSEFLKVEVLQQEHTGRHPA
jgi:hypothetical protein